MRTFALGLLFACGLPFLAVPSFATETTSFTYDALGRVVGSTTAGSVNNNLTVATTFDANGNRTNQSVDPTGNATVTLTDSNLNVLPAHAGTYSCSTVPLGYPINQVYRTCRVIATNFLVYSQIGAVAPTFDAGYSMPSNYTLVVTQAAYGSSATP